MAVDELAHRVALVTGASGGIGRQLSLRLAGAGAALAVHYGANREAAERALSQVRVQSDMRCVEATR